MEPNKEISFANGAAYPVSKLRKRSVRAHEPGS